MYIKTMQLLPLLWRITFEEIERIGRTYDVLLDHDIIKIMLKIFVSLMDAVCIFPKFHGARGIGM